MSPEVIGFAIAAVRELAMSRWSRGIRRRSFGAWWSGWWIRGRA